LNAAAGGRLRQALVALVALPPLLYVLYHGVRGIIAAAKEEPVLEGIAIVIALVAKPDEKLVRELERLGATVSNADPPRA
jgi:hypothetical protein